MGGTRARTWRMANGEWRGCAWKAWAELPMSWPRAAAIRHSPFAIANMLHLRDTLAPLFPPAAGTAPVEWVVAPDLVGYEAAVTAMEERVAAITAERAQERVWLVEH